MEKQPENDLTEQVIGSNHTNDTTKSPDELTGASTDLTQIKQLEGWHKYIGLGTATMAILAVLTVSTGAIISPIVFVIGALMLLPGYMRAPQPPDGGVVPTSVRFVIWLVFFLVGCFFMPKSPELTAQSNIKQTPTPSPEPTATPTPEPTPTQTPTPTATPVTEQSDTSLINQPMKSWKKASKEDRMLAAGAMTYSAFKDKSKDTTLLAYAAKELFDCLNNMNSEHFQESPVHEVAALCAMGMGWGSKE